jgi:hypothetical protein
MLRRRGKASLRSLNFPRLYSSCDGIHARRHNFPRSKDQWSWCHATKEALLDFFKNHDIHFLACVKVIENGVHSLSHDLVIEQ